jgi:hypothetical protein
MRISGAQSATVSPQTRISCRRSSSGCATTTITPGVPSLSIWPAIGLVTWTSQPCSCSKARIAQPLGNVDEEGAWVASSGDLRAVVEWLNASAALERPRTREPNSALRRGQPQGPIGLTRRDRLQAVVSIEAAELMQRDPGVIPDDDRALLLVVLDLDPADRTDGRHPPSQFAQQIVGVLELQAHRFEIVDPTAGRLDKRGEWNPSRKAAGACPTGATTPVKCRPTTLVSPAVG